MTKATKDRALMLRREVSEYNEDDQPVSTALALDMDEWPARHEFGFDWLAKNPEASFNTADNTITLTLTNGSAVYKVVDSVTIDGEERKSTSGLWAELQEGTTDNG